MRTPSRCGSATSRTSPTPPRSSASRRASSPRHLGTNKLETKTFNAGTGGHRGPQRRRHRRHLHRPRPGDQRFPEVERQGDQDRLRRDVRRRLAGRQAGDQRARPTSRARRSSTPKLGNTQDVAAAGLAEEAGLQDRHQRRRRRQDRPAGQRQTLDAFKAGSIDGAWVPEPWATRLVSKAAARCSSTSEPVAEGPVRHDQPHRQPRSSSRPTPTW